MGQPVEKRAVSRSMRFARVLRRDIDAVSNAIKLPWSNGQAEGQINRLKPLKRAKAGDITGQNLLTDGRAFPGTY